MDQTKKLSREKYWKGHIDRHSKTSMSQKEYCRKNNLGYWSFNTWKRKLSEKNSNKDLFEIPGKKIPEISNMPSGIELEINQSLKINITAGFCPELLRNVISALVISQ